MRAWHSDADTTPQSLKQAKNCNHPRYCLEITYGTKVHLPRSVGDYTSDVSSFRGKKMRIKKKKKNCMQVEQCRQ